MYIEKILFNKYYKNNPKALEAIGYERSCASDKTANQKCQIKIRAVGFNFEITKWLEKQHKNIQTAYNVVETYNEGITPKKEDVEIAYKFVKELKELL